MLAGVAHYGGWTAVAAFAISAAAVVPAGVAGRAGRVEQLGDRSRGRRHRRAAVRARATSPSCSSALRAPAPAWWTSCARPWSARSWPTCCWCSAWLSCVGGLKHGTQQLGSERARTIVRPDAAVGDRVGDPRRSRHIAAHAGQRPRDDVLGRSSRCILLGAVRTLAAVLVAPGRRDAGRPTRGAHQAGAPSGGRSGWRSPILAAARRWRGVHRPTGSSTALERRRMDSPRRLRGLRRSRRGRPSRANAVENVVGIQLAARPASRSTRSRSSSTAPSRSPWSLAPGAGARPRQLFGLASLTLVFSPLLVVVLVLAIVLAAFIAVRRRVDLARGRLAGRALRDHRDRFWWG